jgi:hypothetical protein
MKKFQFLLLDAGPIIKLFELNKWDAFIKKCDVTIARTVAEQEVVFATKEDGKDYIDLLHYEKQNLIKVIDVDASVVKDFYDKTSLTGKYDIHEGEEETLAFLCSSSQSWRVCSADHVVFRVLGKLSRSDQAISLEELLESVGLGPPPAWKNLNPTDRDWKYTKGFRKRWTQKGREDFIQDQPLV